MNFGWQYLHNSLPHLHFPFGLSMLPVFTGRMYGFPTGMPMGRSFSSNPNGALGLVGWNQRVRDRLEAERIDCVLCVHWHNLCSKLSLNFLY